MAAINDTTTSTDPGGQEVILRRPRLSQVDLACNQGPSNYWRLFDLRDSYKLGCKGGNITGADIKLILVSDGYNLPKRMNWERIIPLAQRSQIGLMCYNQCSTDELLSFLRSRGRKIPPKCGRPGYIELLHKADINRRFKDFLNLSPEIRDIVYEHYIKSLHSSLTTPSVPPIASASKQMLQEFMPRLCHFAKIRLVLQYSYDIVAFHDASERFLARTTPQMLAKIRCLEIGNEKLVGRDITISINIKTKHFEIKSHERKYEQYGHAAREERVRKLVAEIMEREENNTFTHWDLLKLKRAVGGQV